MPQSEASQMPDLNADEFLSEVGAPAELPTAAQQVPELEAEPPRAGGYAPLISAKRKELIALEEKAMNFSTSDVYLKRDKNGSEYVDHLGFQEDQVRIGRLRRELDELRDRERSMESERSRRNGVVTQVARDVLKRLIGSAPQNVQKTVAESYVRIVQQFTRTNEWMKSQYVDKANIEAAMSQVFDTALGSALRSNWQGASATEGAEAAPPEKRPEDDEDDFTNNLLYAFERTKRRSMTVAEAKAAERAARESGGEGR